MQLQFIFEKLSTQLTPHQKLLESSFWCLPVHTVQVTYKPNLQRQMDILMKMLLIAVEKAPFQSGQALSDVLLVEPLFIQDLLSKMEKLGLINRKEDSIYQITGKGKNQLNIGVYEEEQDVKTVELLYSPTHQSFIKGDLEEVLEYEDFPEQMYRYEEHEEPKVAEAHVLEELKLIEEKLEDEQQNSITIHTYESIEFEQINDIPCIEMVLYDQQQDKIFTRVWNTLLNNWDQHLENEITQKESLNWKEKFTEKE